MADRAVCHYSPTATKAKGPASGAAQPSSRLLPTCTRSSPASLSCLGFPGELNHWWGWELTGLTVTLFRINRESITVRAEWHLSWQRTQAQFGGVDAESIHIVNAESIHISQLQQHRHPSPACCSSSKLGGGLGSAPRGPAAGWAWIWASSITLLSKMMLNGTQSLIPQCPQGSASGTLSPGVHADGFQPSSPLRSYSWVMASSCWDSSAGWQCCAADGECKQQRAGAEHGVLRCAGWQTGHSSAELQPGTAPGCHWGQSPSHGAQSASLYVWALFSKWWGHYSGTLMGLNVSLKVSQLRQSGILQGKPHCLRVWWRNQTQWMAGNHTTPRGGLPPSTSPARALWVLQTLPETEAGEHVAGQPVQLCIQMWDHAHPPTPSDAWGQLDRKQRRGKSKQSSSELFNTSLYCLCFWFSVLPASGDINPHMCVSMCMKIYTKSHS